MEPNVLEIVLQLTSIPVIHPIGIYNICVDPLKDLVSLNV